MQIIKEKIYLDVYKRQAPIVYAKPPSSNSTKPAVPNNSGNRFILNTMHQPITK